MFVATFFGSALSLPQTIGAYFGMKHVKIKERIINLAIWDTAGEEKFDALTNFYCRSARAALVCYGESSGMIPGLCCLSG